MKKYSITFFPKKNDVKDIQSFREKYDPKSKLIAPHITLVFPFQWEKSEIELEREIENKLTRCLPFEIELSGTQLDPDDNFFHLLVSSGAEGIVSLHDGLYSGSLEPFWRKDLPYTPHMTVGVFVNTIGELDETRYEQALEELKVRRLQTTLQFDNVNLVRIDDPKLPRTIVRRFDLS